MLEGKLDPAHYSPEELWDDEFKYWICATELHLTPDEADAVPALRLDRMLAIHNLVKKLKSEGEDGGGRGRNQRNMGEPA